MSSSQLVDISELKTVADYRTLEAWLDDLRARTKHGSEWQETMRWLCLNDLYFLHRFVLSFGTMPHQPTGVPVLDHKLYIDMARATEYHVKQGKGIMASSRRSGKTELRTCALPIQMALKYPDISQTIFSVQKDLAQRHLRRIKNEFEKNHLLLFLFSDILWEDPLEEARKSSITWSVNDGLIIKGRKVNRSTSTIAADVLFGGGVIGSGYDVIYMDDAERRDKVETQAAVEDLDKAVSEAASLLTPIVLARPAMIFSNTRFSPIGIIHRKCEEWAKEDPRLVFEVPAEIIEPKHEWCKEYCYDESVGPLDGRITWPFTADYLNQKYSLSPDPEEYILQHCLSFKTVKERTLREEQINFYDDEPKTIGENCNTYICIDPSRGKIDPQATWVWGLSHDKRKLWLDGNISHFDITTQEYHEYLFGLVSKWSNLSQRVVEIRVEDVAASTWSELIEKELRSRGSWVTVRKVKVTLGMAERKFTTGKADRTYAAWSPMLNRHEAWFPKPVSAGGRGILCDFKRDGGEKIDLVDYFMSIEFRPFPRSRHDDGLDAGGLLEDTKTNEAFPLQFPSSPKQYAGDREWVAPKKGGASWMSAG